MSNEDDKQREISRLLQTLRDEKTVVQDLRELTQRLEDADRARAALSTFRIEEIQQALATRPGGAS